MFSLIFAWINNSDAGDLRRHRGHCDVIKMTPIIKILLEIVNSVSYFHDFVVDCVRLDGLVSVGRYN